MLAFRAPSGLDTSSSWCFWVVVALVLALVLHAHTRPLNRNIDGMPSSMASASSNTCPSSLIWRTTFACPPICAIALMHVYPLGGTHVACVVPKSRPAFDSQLTTAPEICLLLRNILPATNPTDNRQHRERKGQQQIRRRTSGIMPRPSCNDVFPCIPSHCNPLCAGWPPQS